MKNEPPKKISKREEEKAFARPKKPSKEDTRDREFEDASLGSSPWNSLARFCNNSYQDFIPRTEENQKNQKSVVQVHKKCLDILRKAESGTWDEILDKNFDPESRDAANNFFFYISRKHRESPVEVQQRVKRYLTTFVDLAEYAFTDTDDRDLVKLDLIADVINHYQGGERTFLFLSELPSVLDDESRSILQSSYGYQAILDWGASRFLKNFWSRLQQKFRITRVAIQKEVSQNLVRELGETEANLRSQLEQLKSENDDLKNTIDYIRSQSLHDAVYKFAKTLQEQPEPVLDQIAVLQQRLHKKSEEGLPLSPEDSLSVLIALEALLKAFQSLKIIQFPDNSSQTFELRSEQLGEYFYIEGSAFADDSDKKMVRCIRPGWRVGEVIVTPASVKEMPEES